MRRDITMEEVRLHKSKDDAWMVFNGMVYNITPYLKFHPGGVEMLMKAAGRDGTALFMKHHPYVNIGGLLSKCIVGSLAKSALQETAAEEIRQTRLARENLVRQDQGQEREGQPDTDMTENAPEGGSTMRPEAA